MAWPGGKGGSGVYQRLINQIPPHDVFVSAFLGDCAVMRYKLPAAESIGIDRDRANVERWIRSRTIPRLSVYCCCGVEWLRHRFGLYRVDRPSPNSATAAGAAENGGVVPRTFVYLDPPYLMESRRSQRPIYKHELTREQHVELLATAVRLPCPVMINHYPHPLYSNALQKWRTFTFHTQTRGGRPAKEQVWLNYPEPTELHDAR